MSTRVPAAESVQERFDWFTYDIDADGQQICAIRPEMTKDAGQRLVLSRVNSRLLQMLLNEVAQDRAIPFAETRQAILRAMYRALRLSQALGFNK
jgi:hypothetical protein